MWSVLTLTPDCLEKFVADRTVFFFLVCGSTGRYRVTPVWTAVL